MTELCWKFFAAAAAAVVFAMQVWSIVLCVNAGRSFLKELARQLVDNTGYNEISLVSLSTADYSCLAPMIHDMIEEFKDEKVSVSLPSLRIDSFSVDLAKEVQAVRKSGLTFCTGSWQPENA